MLTGFYIRIFKQKFYYASIHFLNDVISKTGIDFAFCIHIHLIMMKILHTFLFDYYENTEIYKHASIKNMLAE